MARTKPEIQGLLDRVMLSDLADLGSECILWPYGKDTYGYGQVHREGKLRLVPGYVLTAHTPGGRPAPPNHVTRHSCDTPACVNPNHLSWGTQVQNIHDAVERGRARGAVGTQNWNAKLTEADVRSIRERHAGGGITAADFAREYLMDHSTMMDLLMGRTWKAVK